MRDFWRHFRLEGWTSVPEKPWHLVPLEWAEIAEVSPAGFASLGEYRNLLKAALDRAPRFRRIWQETASDSQ